MDEGFALKRFKHLMLVYLYANIKEMKLVSLCTLSLYNDCVLEGTKEQADIILFMTMKEVNK